MSHAPPSSLVVNSSIALCCLIWGSTWQVIEQGLRDLPPFTAAAARFLLAGLLMSAAAPWLHRHEGGAPPPRFLWITLGSCTFFGSYGIVYQAETRLAPGVTAVLFAVFSLLMAIAGYLFLGERVSMRQAIGFVLGFLGVAWLFVSDLALLGSDVLGAALLMLGSPLLSAVGTTVTKRCGRNVSSVLLNRN
ncbi:MAG TPA: DMT family transporter, partial [Planctomycetota bacterium]|nr:DMT family transporter [Planctomycetota bacterium]